MVFVHDDVIQANIKTDEILDAKQVVENNEQKLVDISFVHDINVANNGIVSLFGVADGN